MREQSVSIEKTQLDAKIANLSWYVATEHFTTLPSADQELLLQQLSHMQGYAHVLAVRLSRVLPGALDTFCEVDAHLYALPDCQCHRVPGL